MKRCRCAIVLSFLACALCHAAEGKAGKADTLSTLRTVRVDASHRLRDTGLQTTKLDTLALHENISLSMADVLTRNSTLFVKSYGRATESTAEFRGTSPSHTQVTWNGMRINSPTLGTVDFSFIPAYFVDEATLYHGASSLVLTGGGLGGAVDMQTRPAEQEGFGAQYVQGIGSFRTFDQFLRLTYSDGQRWSASSRLSYGKSKNNFRYTNYDKKVDVRDEEGNLLRSYHPKERNRSGYFDDWHAMQDVYYRDRRGNRWGGTIWFTHSLRGLPFLSVDYKENSDFRNEQKTDAVRSVLSFERLRTNWSLAMKGGYAYQALAYDYFTRHEGTRSDITHSRSYVHTGFVQASLDVMPAPEWLLTAQLSTYYNHVHSWDRSPFHIGDNFDIGRWEYHASAEVRWRPKPRFSMAAVLREEMYHKRLLSPIPALMTDYVLYKPWNLIAKATVARNYRFPSMDDLYYRPGGNPDLKPERGFTYDAGISFRIPIKKVTIQGSATAFDSHISNWIQWTPNTRGFWVPDNVKRVHNYGVESTLGATVLFAKGWKAELTGNLACTPSLNRGEPSNEHDTSYGKQLCYVPRRSANLTARLGWKEWELTYHWVHYSERFTTTSNETQYITGRLKPYYMNDASLSRHFHWRWATASLRLAVNNLLGTEYVTVLSRPMAPRNATLYIELKPHWKCRN